MAHSCPDCGMTCHCGSDIDDLLLDLDENVAKCSHCDCEKCRKPRDFCDCDPEYFDYEE